MKRYRLHDDLGISVLELQFKSFCTMSKSIFQELLDYYLGFPAVGGLEDYESPEMEDDGTIWISIQTNNCGVLDGGYWPPDMWMLTKFQDLAWETKTDFAGYEQVDSSWVMVFFKLKEQNLFDSLQQ